MATVISLTEAKIKELLAGWEGVALSQDDINALVTQLKTALDGNNVLIDELNQVTMPKLRDDLAANSVQVAELNDVTLPNLRANLDQAALEIENMQTVDIPAIRQDLAAEITNGIDRPKVYVQPDEPTNPDIDERYLVTGDTWFDSDDGNRHRIWNGVEWSTYNVDVADFSLTVKKFMTNTHQIY